MIALLPGSRTRAKNNPTLLFRELSSGGGLQTSRLCRRKGAGSRWAGTHLSFVGRLFLHITARRDFVEIRHPAMDLRTAPIAGCFLFSNLAKTAKKRYTVYCFLFAKSRALKGGIAPCQKHTN